MEDLREKIRKEIEKSGFPLELYVLDICSKKNTGRMPNLRYTYKGELREIDLNAFFEEINLNPKAGQNLQYTSTSMIIECKKSESKHWVFFSSEMHQNIDLFYFTKYVSGFDLYFNKVKTYPLLGQIYKDLQQNHYMNKEVPKCISYLEVFKNPSGKSEIYEAIDSVITFLRYEMELRSKQLSEFDFHTCFFFPIIVLDGLLFEAQVKNGEVQVEERDYVQLRTAYGISEVFVIDVVKRGYFEKIFNLIERDHLEFVDTINKIHFPEEYKSKLKSKLELEMKNFRLPFPGDYYRRK
jgi:hypothetical protein